jgi:flagellar basal-body rod modification protein FlgD
MTTTPVSGASASTTPATTSGTSGYASLGQSDFLKLMTVQLQYQDPFDPVDNKEMLAQMAQFSSLAGIGEMNDTLKAISGKLDVVLAASAAASGTTDQTGESEAADATEASAETQPDASTATGNSDSNESLTQES